MKVLDNGHKYQLADNKADTETTTLTFFKDAEINGNGYCGTTNQEVLRALIDRVKFLDTQKPHRFNEEILENLRRALVLHEMRHLERLVDQGVNIEYIEPTKTGHYV